MNSVIRVRLQTDSSQHKRLVELQQAFAQVCNTLAPLAQRTGCWNRVALHHMAYRGLREQFPGLGSQMVCNAIYSVSRACRFVYQHPRSPFNAMRLAGKPLPKVQFLPQAPVYFDRHTLSLKDGQVSMFTLDGRMRFSLALRSEDELRFRTDKLREIVLTSLAAEFSLSFTFAEESAQDERSEASARQAMELPEYVLVIEDDLHAPAALTPQAHTPQATT